MSVPRLIAHVDMDAFYASVEQHDQPHLKGQPVIVGGTGRRSVVSAASYEARRFGVRSAMPAYEARRLCPDGIYLPVRMARYREISEQVFCLFQDFTPTVEGLSLDEAFLDLSNASGDPQPLELGHSIKHRIRTHTGLTASVGLGPNKLVAKIASERGKPDGLLHIPTEQVQTTLDPLPVTALWGIGPRTRDVLAKAKITIVQELRQAPDAMLKALFGNQALHYRQLAAGQDERPVKAEVQERSISQETTFEHDLRTLQELEPALREITEALCRLLRQQGLMAHTMVVKLRTPDFARHTRQRRFTPADNSFAALYPLARALLERWLQEHPGQALRLLGVGARDFEAAEQLPLFEDGTGRGQRLEATMDAAQQRFGAQALGRGATAKQFRHH